MFKVPLTTSGFKSRKLGQEKHLSAVIASGLITSQKRERASQRLNLFYIDLVSDNYYPVALPMAFIRLPRLF